MSRPQFAQPVGPRTEVGLHRFGVPRAAKVFGEGGYCRVAVGGVGPKRLGHDCVEIAAKLTKVPPRRRATLSGDVGGLGRVKPRYRRAHLWRIRDLGSHEQGPLQLVVCQ